MFLVYLESAFSKNTEILYNTEPETSNWLNDFSLKVISYKHSFYIAQFSEKKAEILQEVGLQIRSAKFCQNVLDEVAVFDDEKETFYEQGLFCAGGQRGKDSCSGDSGSAIFSKERNKVVQIGLVSGTISNMNCGTEGIPSFYTRVSYYLKWILDNIMR